MSLGPLNPQPTKYRLILSVGKIRVEGLFTVWLTTEWSALRAIIGMEQRGAWRDIWIPVDKKGRDSCKYGDAVEFEHESEARLFLEALRHDGEIISGEIPNTKPLK